MATYSANMFETPKYMIVNGTKVLISEWRKEQRAKNKAKKRTKRVTSITILPSEIKAMLKEVRVLKSFVAYHEHGYKQWGLIAKNIMNLREIKDPFNNVVASTKQAIRLVNKINTIAKKNDSDVFQYVQKLSWKLDEVAEQLDTLTYGITTSGCLRQFADHECISGVGKRLGLKILTQRSVKAVRELGVIAKRLDNKVTYGKDVFEYEG